MGVDNSFNLIDNRFQIEEIIGEGAMGRVYRGTDLQTGEAVAIKRLIANPTGNAEVIERFKREAELLKQLNHPNIVKIIDQVEESNKHYIVMEYLSGGSLADRLAVPSPLPLEQVLKIAIELADALARTHHMKIIHRDIKPGNVLLAADGTPRLTDFGIARLDDTETGAKSGRAVGTLKYLAPEVLNGEEIDARSDLWSFGVMLFEMLSGEYPFPGKIIADTVQSILTRPPLDLAALCPDAPPGLVVLIYQLLEKDRHLRIHSARQVGAILETILHNPTASPDQTRTGTLIPVPKATSQKQNLPPQLTNFIGRQKEVAEVKRLLKTNRLLTLIGTGGVGKTRLALKVAGDLLREFADGVYFVDLAPVCDPALVTQTVAWCMDVYGGAESLADTLIDYVRDKQILLIQDNCEHLIDPCAQLSELLLRVAPKLKILATSREAMNIGGEVVWRVPTLTVPKPGGEMRVERLLYFEAARLFIERAQTGASDFAVTAENAPIIAQICARLEGIPLAIELAAARTKVFSVEQIAARLDDSFRLLSGGNRTALPRQQTLEALIDWSYNLLSPQEQLLLNRLAVFAGGWTLDAAESICAGQSINQQDILELLAGLVNKSLVFSDQRGNETRYGLLETIRQYGHAKLQQASEEQAIRNRHLDYFDHLAEKADQLLYGEQEFIWLDRLDSDHDNFRAALNWSLDSGVANTGLHLATLLGWFWHIRGYWTEGRRWLKKMLAEAPNSSKPIRAKALYRTAWLTAEQGTALQEAQALTDEALALSQELNDQPGIAFTLSVQGNIAYLQDDYPKAIALLEKSLALYRSLNDKWGIGHALSILGYPIEAQGDFKKAVAIYQEMLTNRREIDDKDGTAWALWVLGRMALVQGDLIRSKALYEESLALGWEIRAKITMASALNGLGNIALYQGQNEPAVEFFSESLNLSRELGNKLRVLSNLRCLGHVAFRQGDNNQAETLFKDALTLALEIGNTLNAAQCIAELAEVALLKEQPLLAVQLLAVIQKHAEKFDSFSEWYNITRQSDYENFLSIAQSQLSQADFEAAWAKGQPLSLEETHQFLQNQARHQKQKQSVINERQ